MDGRSATVNTVLIDMLDEVSEKYQISQETLDRYAGLVEAAVKAGHTCGACKCSGREE